MAVAVGDFNGDGRLDVVTANQSAGGISVLLGKGNGTFAAAVNHPLGRHPADIRAVDLNKDGKLDLVIANHDLDTSKHVEDSVSVLIGYGNGTFKPAVNYAAGLTPVSVAVGDLNGDGKLDMAVADNGDSTVTLLFGTGTGRFTAGGPATVGNNPTSVAIGDFNNDQKPDLASVSGGFGHLDVNLNNGDGTFAPKVNYVTGFVANTVAVADLNEDHQPDLVIACKYPSGDGMSVLLGNPDGTFQPFQKYNAGGQHPITLAVADFNRDGHLDVVTANGRFDDNSVSLMLGNGTGALGPARLFVAGQGPQAVAVGDFNADGVPDVVTVNGGDGLGKPASPTGRAGTVTLLLGNGDVNGTLGAAESLVAPGANRLVAADFDGDNLPDLAVTNGNTVLLFPGIGGGAFGPAVPATGVQGAGALAVGDFNGDQKKDLAVIGKVGTFAPAQLLILLGNGDGTFAAPTAFPAGSGLNSIAAADFNGDQKLDLAVANDGSNAIDILLGNGDGSFGAATVVPCGTGADFIDAGDLNGDGKADLVLASTQANQIRTLFGDGQGGFGQPTSYATEVDPASVGIGRFNADAKPDLAVPTFFGLGLSVFQQGTNGKFGLTHEYDTDSRPIGVTVADFTGDGKLDLAVVNNFAATVCVFPGTGLGTFGAPATYVVGAGPTWAAAGDFNGDGRQDLAVLNSNANSVTLLETPAPATHFRVQSFPAPTTAGVATRIVVSALDGAGRLVTGYTGTVGFTSTDPRAALPAGYKFAAGDHGVHTFLVTLRTAGTQTVFVTGTGGSGSTPVEVNPAVANHFQVVAAPDPTAGSPFDVTVAALDPFNNVATGYLGTVRLSTNDPATGVTLPANYTFTAADNGVHTFTGGATLLTAGARTVSASYVGTLWPVASGPVTVHAAAASQLTVSAPVTATAGLPAAVTVTARDQYGNVATDFAGTVAVLSTDAQADLPADYAFTLADQGVHTFQPVLKTAGPQSFTVTSAGVTDGQSGGVLVKPGAAAQLGVVGPPSNTFVGTPLKPPVTVLVRDAFSNPVAAGVKVLLALANNPSAAGLSGYSALTDATGLATFKYLTVSKAGAGYTVVAKAGTGVSAPSAPFTVYKATHFGLTLSVGTTVQAGTSFTVTVTALDGLNRPDPTYQGTVHFSSTSSPLADLPADYTFQPADNGQATFTVTLKRAGSQTVTVGDMARPTVKGAKGVTVTAGAVTQFLVTGPTAPRANVAYSYTVIAADAFGNRVTGYRGTVQFASGGGTTVVPNPYTFTALDAGRHVFKVTFQTPGPGQSLTVADQADAGLTGTEDGITVS